MSINAYRDGQVISADSMNQILQMQDFIILREGSLLRNSSPTVGAYLRSDQFSYVMPFQIASTRLDRVNLDVYRTGIPGDLKVQIRRGMNSPPTATGTVIAERVIPWEWVPDTRDASWWLSIPLGIRTGITSNEQLFLCLDRVGTSAAYFNFAGFTAFNSSFPTYQAAIQLGQTGTWAQARQIRHQFLAGDTGMVRGSIIGGNGISQIDYGANGVSHVREYLPPADDPSGGIRSVLTVDYISGIMTGGRT